MRPVKKDEAITIIGMAFIREIAEVAIDKIDSLRIRNKIPEKISKYLKSEGNYEYIVKKIKEVEKRRKEFKNNNIDKKDIYYKAKDIALEYQSIMDSIVTDLLSNKLKQFFLSNKTLIRRMSACEFTINGKYYYIPDKNEKIDKESRIGDKLIKDFMLHKLLSNDADINSAKGIMEGYLKDWMEDLQKNKIKMKEFKDVIVWLLAIYSHDALKDKFLDENNNFGVYYMQSLLSSLIIFRMIRNKYEHRGYKNLPKSGHQEYINLLESRLYDTLNTVERLL